MRFMEKTEDAVWRAIEWAFVLGMLSWVFVRLWSETLYDPERARAGHRRRRHFWSRLPSSDGEGPRPSDGDDRAGPGGSA
jgi:hypothetical protein